MKCVATTWLVCVCFLLVKKVTPLRGFQSLKKYIHHYKTIKLPNYQTIKLPNYQTTKLINQLTNPPISNRQSTNPHSTINLTSFFFKLFRFFLHSFFCKITHFLSNFHTAKMRTTHRTKVCNLCTICRECFIMKFQSFFGI